MRATAFLIFLVIAGGVTFYIWEHNRAIDAAAAANNGAICALQITLDEELYQVYEGGGLTNVFGDLSTTQNGDQTTTTSSVTTTMPELITDLRQGIAELSVVTGANCVPVVTKFPPMTPGRIQVEIVFFRPYPAEQGKQS